MEQEGNKLELVKLQPEVIQHINGLIEQGRADGRVDSNLISDGYHTFGELYDHRITLYIALCRTLSFTKPVWRAQKHHDGSSFDGWFIMGIESEPGKQISYHLPMSRWEQCRFAHTMDLAPEWDGHTSQDVLNRLSLI